MRISPGGGTQEITYLFIDGGYLKEKSQTCVRDWFGHDGEIDFLALRHAFGAYKTFYYDCEDRILNEDETEGELQARIKAQEAPFNRIRELEGFHVRLGHLAGSPGKKRQKEVDVLLTVDMMNHAFRQNMAKAVLIAGDRDFKPVVESLVQFGTYVRVVSDARVASQDLAWAADSSVKATLRSYHAWSIEALRKKFALPGALVPNELPSGSRQIRHGEFQGKEVRLFESDRGYALHVAELDIGRAVLLTFHDREGLERFFQLEHGAINWSS
jgi:uncharacterized LabA/DUF88 family protein